MGNIWETFAKTANGKFIERKYWHSPKTEIAYKEYKIIFDNYTAYSTVSNNTYEQKYTRVITSISTLNGFKFEIYPKSIISSVAKIFGMQDIETGDLDFDKAFIIKSNNEFKIKQLLNNQKIRLLIKELPKANVVISDQNGIWEEKLPENEVQLSFFTEGEITDLTILNNLRELFTLLLDKLDQMT